MEIPRFWATLVTPFVWLRNGGSMGEFSIWHWVLVLIIALLLFGPSKLADFGKGLGEGIRNFKSAVKEGDEKKDAEKK
jgi:TatA/E family protein of Tat protein translocase